MTNVELIANYFERYINVILSEFDTINRENKSIVSCKLVSLIPEDIHPNVVTAILGFSTLMLKYSTTYKNLINLPVDEFKDYNNSILLFCYEQISKLGINRPDEKPQPVVKTFLGQQNSEMNQKTQEIVKQKMKDYSSLNKVNNIQDLTELFVLTTQIEIFNENNFRISRKKFRMNKQSFELVEDKIFDDIFTVLPDSEKAEIISAISIIPKPSPEKFYKNVFVGLIPEAEQNTEIREIRFKLRENHNSNIIIIGEKEYFIFVDKYIHQDENLVDYCLYLPNEYILYRNKIEETSLVILKQWNEEEYGRLAARIDEINEYDKSDSAQKISIYLEDVRFQFEEWFRKNNFGIPYNRSGLLELIQGRIRKRINEDVKLKRSFMTTSERESYIEELSTKFIKGMNDISASNILDSIIYNKNYILPSELEIVKLIDEFLFAFDERFQLPNYNQEEIKKEENESISELRDNETGNNKNVDIEPINNELYKIIYNENYLKEKIRRHETILEILFFLDETERDLKSLQKNINSSTNPKILDIGGYLPQQYGEDEWRIEFCFNIEKTQSDIMMDYYNEKDCTDEQAKLEADNWNRKNVIDKRERNSYEKKYNNEIEQVGKIYEAIDFIEYERKHYKEQFIKYAQINNLHEQEKDLNKNELKKLSNNESQKINSKENPETILCSVTDEKEVLKTKVGVILKKNHTIVLEKLPKKEQKQNKKWKLSTQNVYIKLFSKEYLNQKDTIMRYIKDYRSNNPN